MELTREEILKLPAGRDLDALIAEKVFGWYVDSSRRLCSSSHKPGEVFVGDCCRIISTFSTFFHLKLLDWILKNTKEGDFHMQHINKDGWHVGMCGNDDWIPGDDLPHAVCRFALLLATHQLLERCVGP